MDNVREHSIAQYILAQDYHFMTRLISSALLAFSLLTCLTTAHADTTINFENLPNPDGSANLNYQGTSVTQNGYRITGSDIRSVKPNTDQFNYSGSVAVFNLSGDVLTLTEINNQPFNLRSLDLSSWFLNSSNRTFLVTGTLAGGGTVTQSYAHSASNSLETVTFGSDFSNLASVSLPGQNSPQYDNIVVSAFVADTPEPGTWAMFIGMGISGGLFLKRRKRAVR